MEVMFNIVMNAMYTEVWGDLSDERQSPGEDGDPDASYEATI